MSNQVGAVGSHAEFGLALHSRLTRRRRRDSVIHCRDKESYYFKPLNECYRIFRTEFLAVDPKRKLAYGGTRSEHMLNCWKKYRGRLLDIGWNHIGEKMEAVKKLAVDFNRKTYKRQAIQLGFMINRKRELISQNGRYFDVLENVFVERDSAEDPCPKVDTNM
ncbi:unnamed protein product [Gongylonema pulchrum]|uniref:HA domain-containing protein n=1 Tax=Gongylonema pulchrum TaxID=637853 RepID=A0A183EA95_9BILA|nr:unnamed protein product [Gongylonema pulchrum]